MRNESVYAFSLCLHDEKEIEPYLQDLKRNHPGVQYAIAPSLGALHIVLRAERPLDAVGKELEAKFPTYVFPERKIEEAVHRELIARKRTLALAESCTGGAIASRLTALPNASYYFLGSIVAYANRWKEKFLGVDPATISRAGAVSAETVEEMIAGIFSETEAGYAIAVSGIAGPSGGTPEKPVGTIYIGVGKRGERSDVGRVSAPPDRASAIEFTVQTSLCALWRRIVHNTPTFS
jgi:nicotinamide-nucleotide amidase